jgi:hypothetical protein
MIYNDMSVITKFLEEVRKSGVPRTFKLWLYVDQVYNCQLQGFIDIINRDADRVFAFTPYLEEAPEGTGCESGRLTCFSSDLTRTSTSLSLVNLFVTDGNPEDAFMFLNMNRNQPRKRYDFLIMAFVELIVKNPQKPVFLMCICDKGEREAGGFLRFSSVSSSIAAFLWSVCESPDVEQ